MKIPKLFSSYRDWYPVKAVKPMNIRIQAQVAAYIAKETSSDSLLKEFPVIPIQDKKLSTNTLASSAFDVADTSNCNGKASSCKNSTKETSMYHQDLISVSLATR